MAVFPLNSKDLTFNLFVFPSGVLLLSDWDLGVLGCPVCHFWRLLCSGAPCHQQHHQHGSGAASLPGLAWAGLFYSPNVIAKCGRLLAPPSSSISGRSPSTPRSPSRPVPSCCAFSCSPGPVWQQSWQFPWPGCASEK